MNKVPDSELVLVPGGTLITATPEEVVPSPSYWPDTAFTTSSLI